MSNKVWWAKVTDSMGLAEFIRLVNQRMTGLNFGDQAVCEIHIDGGGAVITTGIKLDVPFPDFSATITGWELVADQSGSIVIDLWKDSYANFPPLVGDTITASAKPTLSSATKNRATSVPTWIRTINKGDVLRVNVDSASTVKRVTLALSLVKN